MQLIRGLPWWVFHPETDLSLHVRIPGEYWRYRPFVLQWGQYHRESLSGGGTERFRPGLHRAPGIRHLPGFPGDNDLLFLPTLHQDLPVGWWYYRSEWYVIASTCDRFRYGIPHGTWIQGFIVHCRGGIQDCSHVVSCSQGRRCKIKLSDCHGSGGSSFFLFDST